MNAETSNLLTAAALPASDIVLGIWDAHQMVANKGHHLCKKCSEWTPMAFYFLLPNSGFEYRLRGNTVKGELRLELYFSFLKCKTCAKLIMARARSKWKVWFVTSPSLIVWGKSEGKNDWQTKNARQKMMRNAFSSHWLPPLICKHKGSMIQFPISILHIMVTLIFFKLLKTNYQSHAYPYS